MSTACALLFRLTMKGWPLRGFPFKDRLTIRSEAGFSLGRALYSFSERKATPSFTRETDVVLKTDNTLEPAI